MGFDIGNRFKRLRAYLELTQVEVAEKAGIDDKHYGRIERNEINPTIKMIEDICDGLGIPLVQFFMPSSKIFTEDYNSEYNVQFSKALNLAHGIDIHFNQNALIKDCENIIWYNGYIASAYSDEYEMRLSVEGNVRAKVYQEYEEVADINDEDAGVELLKYASNDSQLKEILVFEEYSEEVLKEKRGNAIFVEEWNWLTLTLYDNRKGECIDVFQLDTDNIFEPFSSEDMDLISYLKYFWE